MKRFAFLLTAVVLLSGHATAWPQDQAPAGKKPPDGVYAVQRDGSKEQDVLPLKDGEVLVVQRHRYLKVPENEPPRYLVVRAAPDVALDLAEAPKAVKEEGSDSLRILLKLRPKAAADLERLTRAQVGKSVAIVLGGEVVTAHKIREEIKGGGVQITSCAPGAAEYLLDRLRAHHSKK
jgi:preprotein translocase subunit SecD